MEDELSSLEQVVIRIAGYMALSNKLLTIETIYKEVKRNVKASKEEVSNAIYNLILKKYLFIPAKMTKMQVLLNKNRYQIHQYILKNPGCHLREIMQALKIQGQMVYWHLFTLEKFGFIYRMKYLKYLTFFPEAFSRDLTYPLLSLKNPNSFKIFSTLWEHPVLDLTALKTFIPINLTTLRYHLNRVISSKVVLTRDIKDKHHYILNKAILKLIHKSLNISLEDLKSFYVYQEQIIQEKEDQS